MPRPKGSGNKFNVEKEAAKLQEQVEKLVENTTSPETNLALLKTGMGLSLHTLIRAASGDKTIEGISATNMVSAADKLLTLGIKILGEEAFRELQQKAEDEKEELEEDEDQEEEPKSNVVGFIQRFEGKQ
jgi:hypothetical protein